MANWGLVSECEICGDRAQEGHCGSPLRQSRPVAFLSTTILHCRCNERFSPLTDRHIADGVLRPGNGASFVSLPMCSCTLGCAAPPLHDMTQRT